MGTITQALRTAQSGLLVNQQALDITSRNISNVNTEGYSRKGIAFENQSVAGAGAGVQISQVQRKIDEGLLRSLRLESSDLNAQTSQTTYWARLQDLFGTPDANTAISHTIEELGNALESLVASPNNALEQNEVVRRADNVLEQLQAMSETLQELRLQADQQITQITNEINTLTSEIDTLNDDIISAGAVSRETSDLRDQRDLKVTRLAELIDIRYFNRSDGDIVIFTNSGRTLVDTVPPEVTHNAAAAVTPTTTHAEGNFDGIFIGSRDLPANDATNDIRGGQIKGLIDMRDTVLPNLQSQLDDLAAQMRDTMNQVHNRGVSFPGAQEYNGTRTFVETSTQAIRLDPTGSADDVKLVLFNSTGDQSAITSLNTIMENAGFSSRGSGGDWHIDDIAATMQSWLRNNGAATATASVTSGKLNISLNDNSLNLAIRDETATANGSTQADAEIAYDSNGDGVIDETVSGFSNFFGLNDFFVDNLSDNIWESDVLANGYTATAATLTFRDSAGAIGTLTIAAGSSMSDIVTQISNDTTLSQRITASVIPDGSGQRLRISHVNGSSMQITQATGNTFLTDAGINVADVRTASTLSIRTDILQTPALMSTGAPQWDANRGVAGEYLMSVSDDTIAKALAETMNSPVSFKVSGGLPSTSVSFAERAAAIVSTNASLANVAERNTEAQQSLTDSIEQQFENERGVNLDEEMANLIVFEQAFSAAARVITTLQQMFDALERAV